MSKLQLTCMICGIQFERYKSLLFEFSAEKINDYTCSVKCRGEKLKITNVGENNSNFGKHWTDAKKKAQSELVKLKVDDAYREKSGSANRGKKFSEDRIKKMHGHRTSESYSRSHSEEQKIQIGIKSKEKFTHEFKSKFRKTMEERGNWIPLLQQDDYTLYRDKFANWVARMFDIIEDPYNLLQVHGIFNAKTNSKGVVRDHMFSRKSGFLNGVFPELLRHPANCQLLLHSDNVKKKKSRYNDADAFTLDELFYRVETYKKEWKEQDLCIQLISRHRQGERYQKETYITQL